MLPHLHKFTFLVASVFVHGALHQKCVVTTKNSFNALRRKKKYPDEKEVCIDAIYVQMNMKAHDLTFSNDYINSLVVTHSVRYNGQTNIKLYEQKIKKNEKINK